MARPTLNRSARTLILSAFVATLTASPLPVAGHGALPLPLQDAVDTSSWRLVSDLAAGEPPRFASTAGPESPAADGAWSALGSIAFGEGALDSDITAIAISGANVYVGGAFLDAAGIPEADYVAKWNGSVWSALGSNGAGNGALNGAVDALVVSGDVLHVGGRFTDAAGITTADKVARWNGNVWSALGSNGAGNGALNGNVTALAILGTDVVAGGYFTNAGGADHLARWDGSAWSAVGSSGAAFDNIVYALQVSGTNLYAGGYMEDVAGIPEADWVAKWDGTEWSALGSDGAGDGVLNGPVYALASSGSELYAGGFFGNIAGLPQADNIARWDGSAWSALGSDGDGDGPLILYVFALAVSGNNLYVGGQFTDAAGIPEADHVALWDGAAWSALGSDGGALDDDVYALATAGSTLYVGGAFDNAAGIIAADHFARFTASATTAARQPDGRIRIGTSGAFVGNNVYNTTGAGQSRTAATPGGGTVTFGISVQNDGSAPEKLKVKGAGSTPDYTVTYKVGTNNITAAVVAGTHRTPVLAVNATQLIKVTVRVKNSAPAGSRIARKVTITSLRDATKKDAVKFVAKRV